MQKKARKSGVGNARIWIKAEFVYLFFSFLTPYLMAVVFFLISDYSLGEIFARAGQYALCGVFFFGGFNVCEFYLYHACKDVFERKNTAWLIAASVTIAFLVSTIFARTLSPFGVPLVFIGLVVALLADDRFAFVVHAFSPVLFFFAYFVIDPDAEFYDLVLAATVQMLAGGLMIAVGKRHYTRISFFINCLTVAVAAALPLSVIGTLLQYGFNVADVWRILVIRAAFSALSMVIGLALFMVLTPIAEVVFGMFSRFRLEEICSYDAPLMRRLATEAPGTYNHSVAMGTLAQECANAIGENAALAKAGACYHDMGKLKNPVCFTENQTDYNPHDDLIPEVSTSIITRHPVDGAELIRKNHLPEAIAEIALEHHGTQPVTFFLNKTRGITEGQTAENRFCYKGPKPSTKISGIIMIVDTVEAATRAQGVNKSKRELTDFIHKLIAEKTDSGQFSDCPLTLKDLSVIEQTLVRTIPGLYHQRIKYTK